MGFPSLEFLFGSSSAAKRPSSSESSAEESAKRRRTLDSSTSSSSSSADGLVQVLCPDEPSGSWSANQLEEVARTLRDNPFSGRLTDSRWALKRRLLEMLPKIVQAAERNHSLNQPCFNILEEAFNSGYIATVADKKVLVEAGAWKPALAVTNGGFIRPAKPEIRAGAARLYVQLAEHISFYDDFAGLHKDFWDKNVFGTVLKQMPLLLDELPANIQADQWELYCPEIEGILKCIGCFMMFWMNDKGSTSQTQTFDFNVDQLMPLLDCVLLTVTKFDNQFGQDISAKVRGDLLEEIVRLSGLLAQFVMTKLDENINGSSERDTRRKQSGFLQEAVKMLNMLVRVLMLKIPTCVTKSDSAAPGSGAMPADERQLESDWIEGLLEPVHGALREDPVPTHVVAELFKTMAEMPVEEQKYRLECAASLVPPFVSRFSEQLHSGFVPPMLKDLKVVLNAVLQEESSLGSDLLEEISFFPCLLDFTSKRSIIHTVCEHHRLQASNADPIRLVVARDNVLDGVCSSLNLQDQQARIEVPLEIEFRSGYADDNGQELVDEGEDQGGLRRQWLDRASRHFISSDLFMSPSDDASHLAKESELPTKRTARGSIFVPSPEPVCKYVQEDWEEQFELFGCILGFALLYKETIPVHFGHNFLQSVFGLKTRSEDLLHLLESVDDTLYKKLLYIRDGSYKFINDSITDALEQSNLPLHFVINESHCPELVQTSPLKPGGETIPVTEENKEEFVLLLLHRVLISGVAKQVECFRRGLLRVVPEHVVLRIAELMSVKEIQLMVCGIEEVDVDDWEKHTQYENGFTHDHQVVQWFWDVVRSMTQTTRASLLSFATGSSQVPSGGFRFLQPELFTIQRVAVEDRFPEAHTCVNTIDLPLYSSREELERKLYFAVQEAGDAFGRR